MERRQEQGSGQRWLFTVVASLYVASVVALLFG